MLGALAAIQAADCFGRGQRRWVAWAAAGALLLGMCGASVYESTSPPPLAAPGTEAGNV